MSMTWIVAGFHRRWSESERVLSNWHETLQTLDVGTLCDLDTDGLLSLDGDDDGYGEEVHGAVADVPPDASYGYTPRTRTYDDARMIGDARDHLRTLPVEGETRHLLLGGNYTPWSIVPAVHMLGGRIRALTIATLSYSKYNAADLLGMVDRNEIGHVTLLVARMFSSKNPELYNPLRDALRKRGHHVTTYRTHARLFLFEMETGETYAVEGSANLRSCKCVEQLCMTRDRGLYDWHRTWIKGVFEQVGEL